MILLASNAHGTARLPPLITGKSETPRCFKNVTNFLMKYVANRKAWIQRPSLLTHLCHNEFQNIKDFTFHWPEYCSSPRHKLSDECENYVFPPDCTSILQPLDQRIMRSFKHYYHKQLARKTISMIDHKLLHDAATLMMVNVLDAQHFIAGSWCCVTHKQ
jgi:hypothetical protein